MAYYKRFNLVENITSDGDYPSYPVELAGDKSVAIYGTFGTATLQFVFFTEDEAGTLQELPALTDLTFTSAEGPYYYKFPIGMPIKVRVSGSDVSTDISINIHDFETDL